MYSKQMYKLGNQPSPIRELFNYGKKMAAQIGEDHVFDFTIGNPSVAAPAKVSENWARLLAETDPVRLHSYTVSSGRRETRQAIADDLNERYGTNYGPQDFYLTCGAAAALNISIMSLTISGESEFIVMAPYFAEYTNFIESKGGKCVVVDAAPDFRINFADLEKAINKNTQAILINSPNNPGGKVYSREELEELARLLEKKSEEVGHPIYLISDEPYRELVYDNLEVPFIPTIYANTLVCYSWSKSFSIPGERIGYVLVPPEADDAEMLNKAISGSGRTLGYVCAPALAQHVIETSVKERPDLTVYEKNRQILYEGLKEIGYDCVHPDGAFYLFLKAPQGDGQAFSDRAKEKNVLVVPGGGFGCPDYVRISYCVPTERIERAMPVFKELFA